MRRVLCLLLIAIAFSTTVATSQNFPLTYQGDVQLGYSIGIGTFKLDRVNLQTVHGFRMLDNYLFVGVGTGFDIYTEDGADIAIPLFLSSKVYAPIAENVEVFFGMDLGASIGITSGLSDVNGFLFVPGVGAEVKVLEKNAVRFGLGYNLQKWSASGWDSINTDAFQLKIGYVF